MKRNQEEVFKFILKKDFDMAKKMIINLNYKELSDFFMDLSFETENEILYKFISYLIKTEKNKKKLIDYHIIASSILSVAIPYLPYSFKKAIFHVKKAIKLNPNDISLKEHLLFIYEDPNAKESMSRKEAEKIAKEILKKKSDSYIANVTLNDLIKHRKKGENEK